MGPGIVVIHESPGLTPEVIARFATLAGGFELLAGTDLPRHLEDHYLKRAYCDFLLDRDR